MNLKHDKYGCVNIHTYIHTYIPWIHNVEQVINTQIDTIFREWNTTNILQNGIINHLHK